MVLPAAIGMGVALPALTAAARSPGAAGSAWVGRVFASNTLGTITGSLFCGFVLLGRVGSERILTAAAGLALALGLAAILAGQGEGPGPSRRAKAALGLGALAQALAVLGLPRLGRADVTMGSHYYWTTEAEADPGSVVALKEDAQSGYISVFSPPDRSKKTMKTNGKYEGNDTSGEFQDLFALFGALYLKHYDRALLVGIGPSRTLRVLYAMPFSHIEAVEQSPAILATAAEHFSAFAKEPFEDHARVTIACDDGRNHLQLSRQRYDYLAVAITGAAFAGAGNIYSRDFFQSAKDHLADDGVFMLWIQIHHVLPPDVRSVIYTLRQVFPHVHFYTDRSRNQGYLLASKSALTIDHTKVMKLLESPYLKQTLAFQGYASPLELVGLSMFTSDADLNRYFADRDLGPPPRLLSDFFPGFEYAAPYGLATPYHDADFPAFSDHQLPRFDPPLPEDLANAVRALR
ncbi:MAG: fused MFS/spermidine synthase [Byssovorax sp.]